MPGATQIVIIQIVFSQRGNYFFQNIVIFQRKTYLKASRIPAAHFQTIERIEKKVDFPVFFERRRI
ncbi:MAG: hypothetical protein BWY90_01405 [Deltaproteobacteria bacterium ADurb.BinA014]|nr:MAG: hypothetical protein BWY90_01405 [Deltaproteobacteria bacterium ADurb.BinA014]